MRIGEPGNFRTINEIFLDIQFIRLNHRKNMSASLKDIKRKVIEDWKLAFPQLSGYSQNKLYKVTGPIVVGIELVSLPRTEAYRPHFAMYPLWKNDVKTSLDVPIVLKEYFNKKRLQYSIPYEKHSQLFSDVLESIKQQTPISFDEDISLKDLD